MMEISQYDLAGKSERARSLVRKVLNSLWITQEASHSLLQLHSGSRRFSLKKSEQILIEKQIKATMSTLNRLLSQR